MMQSDTNAIYGKKSKLISTTRREYRFFAFVSHGKRSSKLVFAERLPILSGKVNFLKDLKVAYSLRKSMELSRKLMFTER